MSTSPRGSDSPADWRASVREVGPYLGLGLQLALSMAFFAVGGYLLDRWLDTLPWLTIAGSVVGMAAVFVLIFRIGGEIGQRSQSSKEQQGARPSDDGKTLR